MYLKFKEIFKQSVVYGIASSLQNVLSFLLLPLLTNYLAPSEFGVYSIILLISAFASAIFYFGTSSALGRFYYEEDNELYRKAIVSMSLLISLCGALLLGLIGVFFGNNLSFLLFKTNEFGYHILLSFLASASGFLLNIMTLILRYDKKLKSFVIVTVLGISINFFITYVLLTKYRLGLLAPIYGLFSSNIFSFLVLLWINKVYITKNLKYQHLSLIFFFGIQTSISSFVFYLLDWVDRLILKDLLPMSDVGVYSFGYKIGSVVNFLIITPFALVWAPTRMKYAKETGSQKMTIKTTSYFAVAGYTVIFLAVLFSSEALNLFFTNKDYSDAKKIFPLIMMGQLFFGFQNIVDFGIYLHKKVHYYIIVALIGIFINVIMNFWLIPIYGFMASAYITVITYVITSYLIYLFSSRYYLFKLEWVRIVSPIFIIFILFFFINYTGFFINYAIAKKIMVLIFITSLFYKFWILPDEKKILKSAAKKIFN